MNTLGYMKSNIVDECFLVAVRGVFGQPNGESGTESEFCFDIDLSPEFDHRFTQDVEP